MDIETRLADFLRREADLPPYPGACCKMADRWVALVKGFSPLDRYGRGFESNTEVQAWLAEPGGIAVAVNRVMRACGFTKTKEPRIGDFGLVIHGERASDLVPVSMAILGRNGWHSRNSAGLLLLPGDTHWKAWAI